MTLTAPAASSRSAASRRSIPPSARGRWIPVLLALAAVAVAFAQRPGQTYTDTRIELTVDPSLFLSRVAQMWSSTFDLGHVQAGQFVGYLFPMAPWFGGANALGIPPWVSERLWLGIVLGFAAWGAVRVLDELYDSHRGIAHLVAGGLYAFNPYTVVHMSRGSVTLLGLAILPWLLVATHRGLREPHGWRWPATIGLLLALSGAGVNLAVVFFLLPAPVGLLVYERVVIGRTASEAGPFAWRAVVCATAGSLWWIVPVTVQGLYGADFLSFTESPSTIWATDSMSESLRLLGYWISYLGIGASNAGPVLATGPTYLFSTPVIVATFLVPIVALGGARIVRGWRYTPYFLVLAVIGLLVMAAGFPEGKPLNQTMSWLYDNVASLRFLRTTYKAAPLVALAIACLAGPVVATLLRQSRAGLVRWPGWLTPPRIGRTPTRGLVYRRRRPWRVPPLALLLLVPIPFLAALPLFTGQAVDRDLAYGHVPRAWKQAIHDADLTTPRDRRLMILPGQPYGFYNWGDTFTSVAPALTRRPVLTRSILRYAEPNSEQLQSSVDDLVSQGRLVPGQLEPLLALMGVGQVLVATDGDVNRSGELGPAELDQSLRDQPGFQLPARTYGREHEFTPAEGRGGAQVREPELRRYVTPGQAAPGIVRVQPRAEPTILDGDAGGITELAAYPGALRLDRAIRYAGDLRPDEVVSSVVRGARLVFTDSNRRRAITAARSLNVGPTVGTREDFRGDVQVNQAFPRGLPSQTVAVFSTLDYLRSPDSGPFLSPQFRPYAAFDGRLDTTWLASFPNTADRWIELRFRTPRPVPYLTVHPHNDQLGRTERIAISIDGGHERHYDLRPGWNRLAVGAQRVSTLRLRVTKVSQVLFAGWGGLDEVQIPGLTVQESLRMPTILADLTRQLDLRPNEIDVLASRTTADFPYQAGNDVGNAQSLSPLDQVDAETDIKRVVTLPATRIFALSGWSSVAPAASDPSIDALAGLTPRWRFASSSRFEGIPARRASSAFDGSTLTAWAGNLLPGRTPWLAISAPRPFSLDRVRLFRAGFQAYAFPRSVRFRTDARVTPVVPVAPDGTIRLPRRVRTRSVRIDIITVRQPQGLPGGRLLRAVAIGEVRIPGLRPPRVARRGTFATACGAITAHAGPGRVTARVTGSIAALDRGGALPMQPCGAQRSLQLHAGSNELIVAAGNVMRPDNVRLVSPGAVPPPPVASATAGVLDPGTGESSTRSSVRLRPPGLSWLVLGESYSIGWRAWCTGPDGNERGLGRPERIDGFANGWPIDGSCVRARFAFAPQAGANISYWVSGLGCLLLASIVVFALFRRGRARWERVSGDADGKLLSTPPNDPLRRMAWRPAVALAAAVLVCAGYVFAWRAGVVLGIGTLALVYVGISVRRLLALALAGLIAVPVLYVINPAPDVGGFFFGYAQRFLDAHWVAVGAVTCLLVAGLLGAAELRRQRLERFAGETNPDASRVEPSAIVGLSTANAGRDDRAGEVEATP